MGSRKLQGIVISLTAASELYVDIVGVTGSIPVAPTIFCPKCLLKSSRSYRGDALSRIGAVLRSPRAIAEMRRRDRSHAAPIFLETWRSGERPFMFERTGQLGKASCLSM